MGVHGGERRACGGKTEVADLSGWPYGLSCAGLIG